MELPNRKSMRLKNYDYSTPGAYFVTICTKEKRKCLSRIVGQGLAPAESRLTTRGEIVQKQLMAIENRYPHVRIDKYVIMPNHVHMILEMGEAVGASPHPTLSKIICTFKSLASRMCEEPIWQTSFYDHVIRGDADYQEIWQYIDTNPDKWMQDRFYCE